MPWLLQLKRAQGSRNAFNLAAILLCVASASSLAQTHPGEGECRPEELDLGEFCASLPPAHSPEEQQKRRVTPFRAVGMMPGRTDSKSVAPSSPPATKATPAEPPEPPGPKEGGGYYVQLGAYSSSELAQSVTHSVESPGPPVSVVPVHSRDRVLWACVVGPFRDKESSVEARDRLRADERFRSAFVKYMESASEQDLAHDKIEK